MDRAPDYGFGGWEFESSRVHMRFNINKENNFLELFLLFIFFFNILMVMIFIKSTQWINGFLLKDYGVFYTNKPVYYNYLNYKNYIIYKPKSHEIFQDQGKKINNYQGVSMALGLNGWLKGSKTKKIYDLYFIDQKNPYKPVVKIIDIQIKNKGYEIKYVIVQGSKTSVVKKFVRPEELNKTFF